MPLDSTQSAAVGTTRASIGRVVDRLIWASLALSFAATSFFFQSSWRADAYLRQSKEPEITPLMQAELAASALALRAPASRYALDRLSQIERDHPKLATEIAFMRDGALNRSRYMFEDKGLKDESGEPVVSPFAFWNVCLSLIVLLLLAYRAASLFVVERKTPWISLAGLILSLGLFIFSLSSL